MGNAKQLAQTKDEELCSLYAGVEEVKSTLESLRDCPGFWFLTKEDRETTTSIISDVESFLSVIDDYIRGDK